MSKISAIKDIITNITAARNHNDEAGKLNTSPHTINIRMLDRVKDKIFDVIFFYHL